MDFRYGTIDRVLPDNFSYHIDKDIIGTNHKLIKHIDKEFIHITLCTLDVIRYKGLLDLGIYIPETRLGDIILDDLHLNEIPSLLTKVFILIDINIYDTLKYDMTKILYFFKDTLGENVRYGEYIPVTLGDFIDLSGTSIHEFLDIVHKYIIIPNRQVYSEYYFIDIPIHRESR